MGMKVIKPGLKYYVNLVKDGSPFSFVRYGEGEIKWLIPKLPTKKGYPSFKDPKVRPALVKTLLQRHRDPAYIMAIQHRWHFKEHGKLWVVENYMDTYARGLEWHWAGVFRHASLTGKFFPMIDALRRSKLPVYVVGPKRIAPVLKEIGSTSGHHIIVNHRFAFQEIDEIEAKIRAIDRPALISFSASFTAKILIHKLFPDIGKHSTMIDFGSLWDGYCYINKRPYHRALFKVIGRNLGYE